MRRSGTGWPEGKKYRVVPVQLLHAQYASIPADEPASQWIREAVEERLLREVPGYQREEDEDDHDHPGRPD